MKIGFLPSSIPPRQAAYFSHRVLPYHTANKSIQCDIGSSFAASLMRFIGPGSFMVIQKRTWDMFMITENYPLSPRQQAYNHNDIELMDYLAEALEWFPQSVLALC